MKKLLYISLNDGSDIRVRKELKSLSIISSSIFFLGTTQVSPEFVVPSVFYASTGVSYRSILGFLFFVAKAYYLLLSNNFFSIHVVDEQLYLFLWPALSLQRLFRHPPNVVLDIFDSIFLKFNIFPSSLPLLFLKLLYFPVDTIIVTDYSRLSLYPCGRLSNLNFVVLPNVPEFISKDIKPLALGANSLTIAYIGTLNYGRGSKFLSSLLNFDSRINILSAGIVTDSYTIELINSFEGRWFHHGYLPSDQLQDIVSANAHCLLLLYPPTCINNIFASPNKLWDAYAWIKPILINSSTLVSAFVASNNLGVVYDDSLCPATFDFVDKLMSNYDLYLLNLIKGRGDLKIWSNYDQILCSSHSKQSLKGPSKS